MRTTTHALAILQLLAAAAALASLPAARAADIDGARLFKNACGTCHSSNAGHRIGPSLVGLKGRVSGTAPGFDGYSEAMKKAALTWDAPLLDRFLAAPQAVVKGTGMSYPGLKNEAERRAIVDYVMSLDAP